MVAGGLYGWFIVVNTRMLMPDPRPGEFWCWRGKGWEMEDPFQQQKYTPAQILEISKGWVRYTHVLGGDGHRPIDTFTAGRILCADQSDTKQPLQ